MYKCYSIVLAFLLSIIISGCGGKSSSETSPIQQNAIEKIANYANDEVNAPSLQLYHDAGITGVSEDNLQLLNTKIKALEYEDVDSKDEIQAIVNQLNTSHITTPVDVNTSEDKTAPIITLIGTDVNITVGDIYTDAGATATDNKDGDISDQIITTGSVDTDKVGTYTIVYKVKDVAGNEATVTRKVIVQERSNMAPTISGTPKTSINIYDTYQFLPTVEDRDGDTLSFNIQNKPSWAEFNRSTGLLEGVPSVNDEGEYSNIIISVSDGTNTASLTPFTIMVNPAIDIAHKFGKATQGTLRREKYEWYQPAKYAIDNNDTTYNHTTGGEKGKNWLQIELPNPTKVHKIVLQSSGYAYRLKNAKIYISDTPYTGGEIDGGFMKVADVAETNKEQIFTLDAPVSGRYLLVKGEKHSSNQRHLQLNKLEVYGKIPKEPVFNEYKSSYTLPHGSMIALTAIDYQNDTLTYTIDNPNFTIDENAQVQVSNAAEVGDYNVTVTVSDGLNSTSINLTFTVPSSNAIEKAIKSGSVENVTEMELIQAAREQIASNKAKVASLLFGIYGNNSIYYDPTRDSFLFEIFADSSKVFPILTGNKTGKALALVGEKEQSRFSAFASNPFRTILKVEKSDAYNPYMKKILAWLMRGEPIIDIGSDANKTIALSFLYNTYKTDTKTWFKDNYPNFTIKECNVVSELKQCYDGVDLVMLGRDVSDSDIENVLAVLDEVVASAKPILYTHVSWTKNEFSKRAGEFFGFTLYGDYGNYFPQDITSITSYKDLISNQFDGVDKMLIHFQLEDYNFDWSQCKPVKYRDPDCSVVEGFSENFLDGVLAVRSTISLIDESKYDIFKRDDYRLEKLLVLIGDKMRQSVKYPMDKEQTDDTAFLKSFYSDNAVFHYREINPTQPDMGNFSRSDFSHITPTTKMVNLTSRKPFRSTGVYALPGQTVTVTRKDSADVEVKVFINTLKSEATHTFAKDGYLRPKYLQTPHYEIKPNETIQLTSPYGGPLQLAFDTNDINVSVTFENVGEHPYWRGPKDNDTFAAKMADGEYDWAEIATSGFEVHARRDKMLVSIEDSDNGTDKFTGVTYDPKWNTAEGLVKATRKYIGNYPYVLAGFKGEGIDVVPEIVNWAKERDMTIDTIDSVQHMNSDQASCGYGCSGNPYDAYWSFDPIEHGDIHELGHNLEWYIPIFDGFSPLHSRTNTFAYYAKSMYFKNEGKAFKCAPLPFKKVFDTVQSSVGESNVTEYLKTNLWGDLGAQYLLTMQAMMHAQKMGKLENGWHVLARVYIIAREMARAKKDWENKKASVGFSTYSLDEIKEIPNNDWLVIAYSYASGVDFSDYFDMMGIPYSQKARDQIASYGFEKVPKELFVSTDLGYCMKDNYGTQFDRPTLPIDENTTYPDDLEVLLNQ